MKMRKAILTVAVILTAACQQGQPGGATATPGAAVLPAVSAPHGLNAAKVARGAEVYKANCAACHGDKAQGAPNWAKKGPDGKFPPPPLDARGHAWHHPMSMLAMTVKEGTIKKGGGMPAWTGILKDADIEAVLAYVQSLWPEEMYKSWKLMDDKARAGLMHHH
jgi:mono/diheme cytochrome c family protein